MANEDSNSHLVTCLYSRHSAGLAISLSRHRTKWFLTYPRAYGMVAYPGQRIVSMLNRPHSNEDGEHARHSFWLNPTSETDPYAPDQPAHMVSPIHILLDSETPVAKLSGRMRTEPSNFKPDNGKERVCYEVEIFMPDTGLLRQCYYCLSWEHQSQTNRWKVCGDDVYWCKSVSHI